MVFGLQGIVVELFTDESEAVVVKVKVRTLLGVVERRADAFVDAVTDHAGIAPDLALEETVAVACQQPGDLGDGHFSDEDTDVIEVLDDGFAVEAQGVFHRLR